MGKKKKNESDFRIIFLIHFFDSKYRQRLKVGLLMPQITQEDCQGVGCLVGRITHAGSYLPMLTRAPPPEDNHARKGPARIFDR